MQFDLSKKQMSKNDVRKGLQLPRMLTEELAEDIGIMVGDGHVGIHKNTRGVNYQVCVSCSSVNDYNYLDDYVYKLKKKLYNLNAQRYLVGKNRTEIRLTIYSKGLVEFYSKTVKLPVGKKDGIRVPGVIMKNENSIKKAFLRGFVDTDGGLTFVKNRKIRPPYPRIKLVSASRGLIEDIKALLVQLGFSVSATYGQKRIHAKTGRESTINEAVINGREGLARWIKLIGFSNCKNKDKIEKNLNGPIGTFWGEKQSKLLFSPFEPKT